VNNPPLPTALPSIRHGQLPWQVKAHTAYSPQIPRHKQTPASAFANYYENAGGLANAARKAMEYNQAGNAPTNAPELDLSDENLLKPRTVYRTSLTNPEVSGMSFDGGNIVIKPPVRGFLSRKIAEHELAHQLQKQRSIESVTNPNRVGRSWTPAKWALRPEELDAYAASPIKRLYAQMTGKLVDSPEEAEKALNWMKQLRDDIEFFPDNFEMQENRKTPIMQYLNANNIRPSTVFNRQLAEAVGNFDSEFGATREFQQTDPLFRAFSSNIEDAVRRGAILERYKDVPVDAIPMFIDIMHGSSILGEMSDKDRTDEERKAMREYIIKRMPGIVSNQQSTTDKIAGDQFCSADQNWLEKLAVTLRKNTYVGDDAALDQEQIDSLIADYEKNTGQSLKSMPVLANKKQFWRNAARYYVPSTLRQVPSRAWRAVSSLHPRSLLYNLVDLLDGATIQPGDFYHSGTGTVNVGKGDPATLAHEIGHYVDYEQNKGPFRRGWLGGRKNTRFNRGNIASELAATLWARKAMGEKAWKKHGEPLLLPALGTYMADYALTFRNPWEWITGKPQAQADPKWMKSFDKVLAKGDPAETDRAVRNALLHEFHNIESNEEPVIDEDEETGTIAWNKKALKRHKFHMLLKKLVDSEYAHTYGKDDKPSEKKAGWLEKESADYPALKQSAALPWRDRAEVYATNPEGKIFGGIWDNDKSFAVPGGGVDPGEDPEQAAIRELFEEAGMRAANPRRLPVRPVTNPWKEVPAGKEGYRGSRTHFVLADLLSDKPEEGALDNWGAAHRGLYAIADALKQMQGKTPQAPNVHAARLKVLQYLADQAAKSKEPEDKPAEKKAGWLDNLRAWSPTAKAGLLGAGAGGLAGGLGGWLMGSGGSREPISKEIAYKLFSANVPQEIIYKLLNPDESDELTADEVAALKQGGFDYDDIAPLSGGMGSTVTGALLGAGLGGLGGVALQELPRLYGGFQAPLAGAAKAKSWIPGFMQNWWGAKDLTDRAAEVGAAAGVDAWKGMSRDDQYKAVEEHMPIPLPATMFDRGLDMFATEPPKPDSPPTT